MTEGGARDPLIGSLFNNYRIDALLAQGGMGAVYLLRDATLPNIRKVLKVILPEFANNASLKERFLREAEAVSMLRHPKIVGIDAIGTLADGRLCMVIPFLEGKPLDQFLAEHGGRLAPHRVMHILAHIAHGLDHVHRQGIIHRDLKPGNVFVEPTEDDRYLCKVLDFGIAKQRNARSKRLSPTLSAPTGTPCYMAVEQYVRPGDVTPAADVFALAIMVWQMVTGHLPWGEHEPAVLYQKQLHEPPERPVGNYLSPGWEALLREALSPDPHLRPQSVRQFVQPLASRLPAIEPLFPSGVEILARVARNLLSSAHDHQTVRNPSDRPLVPAWPVHDTPLLDGRAPQSIAAPAEACAASPGSLSPATVNQRRGGAAAVPAPAAPGARTIASQPTTLVSTGTIAPSAQSPRWRKRALLGLAAAGSIGAATLALVTVRADDSVPPLAETVRKRAESLTMPPVRSVPTAETHATSGSTAITTMHPTAAAQSDTRPTAPIAPTPASMSDRPASSPAAIPAPPVHFASPTGGPPTVQSSAMQPTEPTSSTSRASMTMQPPPAPARSAGRPTVRAKPRFPDGVPGTTKPTTGSSPDREQARPEPAQSPNFDPDEVGGQEK